MAKKAKSGKSTFKADRTSFDFGFNTLSKTQQRAFRRANSGSKPKGGGS